MNTLNLLPEYQRLRQATRANAFRPEHSHEQVLKAHESYEWTFRRGRWHRFWARVRRRSVFLWSLRQVRLSGVSPKGKKAGVRLVPLAQIQGSEAKADAFDRAFYPLQERTRDRWVGVALARATGQSLPPVELVLVDDGCRPLYFVRDGHHRISVARAYGQTEIEAEVAHWRVRGQAPWSKDTAAERRCAVSRPLPRGGLLVPGN